MEKFLTVVAEIFEVDPKDISMKTKYGEYEIWDSLMMMKLIMEIEAEYGCQIPIEKAAVIKTLEDLYQYTQN